MGFISLLRILGFAALGAFVTGVLVFLLHSFVSTAKPKIFTSNNVTRLVVYIGFSTLVVMALRIFDPIGAFASGFAVTLMFSGFFSIERMSSLPMEKESAQKMQEAEKRASEHPDKVLPAWEISRIHFESYIKRNLFQIRLIFMLTVGVMLIGFGIIVYGIYKAVNGIDFNIAMLTAIAGVITEFIGATFLIVYRSTLDQASEYVKMLERINAVGMSLKIMDLVSDNEPELKNKSLADLSKTLLETFSR